MFLSCLFLILGYKAEYQLMKPGYWTSSYTDSTISFELNYSYDAVFILGNPESSIKVKFLDMIEYQTISPKGFGFIGQFLTNVEITSTTNETHSIQVYILPKDYCSHNYLTYYSLTSQLFQTTWNDNSKDHFQVCYLYQSDREDIKLTAKLNSDASTNLSYAYPEDYQDGTFNGHVIHHSENTDFDLKKGMIIRLQGKSHYPSKFDLTVKPIESSKNESANISSLPFYYVVLTDGYNFLNDVNLQFEIKLNRLVDLTPGEIGGIVTSVVIFALVIVFTLLFLLKRFAWCCYKKQKRI